jgi:hypothetical protein
MTEASLAVQKAIRARLTGNSAVTDLVPADNVFDRHARPERFPCIVIGEAHSIYPDWYESFHTSVYCDLHIWTNDPDLVLSKELAAAVRLALMTGPWSIDGHLTINLKVASARFMRDPDGVHAHAVLSVEVILQEVANA